MNPGPIDQHKTGEMLPTRQSLLDRLKELGDHESWRTFFETYWLLIYHTAVKTGLNDAEAQDVVQETIISVFKKMPEFTYRKEGSFKSWLLQLTSWRIQDQLRRRNRESGNRVENPDDGTALVEKVPDPTDALQAEWNKEWEVALMDAAIHRAKEKVDSKQYQLFDLYVMKGWSVSRVARTMGVNAGSVYLARHRVGKLIQNELAELRAHPI